jgi:predicted DNA-binding transcriptional regulator YafY
MQRKHNTLTLSVPSETKDQLAELARRFDLVWGEKPSPSKLVAAIASGEIPVGTPTRFDLEQTEALLAAIKALESAGATKWVKVLTGLTMRQGSFEGKDAGAIYEELERGAFPWREPLEQAITDCHPVVVTYRSGKKNTATRYVARFARLLTRDGHWYVDIFADEAAEKSSDLDALKRNRRLRLDKIETVVRAVHPVGWLHDGLPAVTARLKFIGPDAQYYIRHPDDVEVGELEEIPTTQTQVRNVRRNVYTSWWFVRDVLRHGDSVVVEEPPELVKEVSKRLEFALGRYRTTGPS